MSSRDLAQLLDQPDSVLDKTDVALLNLICAVDLPGAEDLDIPGLLGTLDEWADLIRLETDRNYYEFVDAPGMFNNSQAYFCVLYMITVLQRKCGVRYNPKWTSITPDRPVPRDFGRDAGDLFIHAIIDGPGGTCGSLPVLYAAVGRRLGYPLKIVKAHQHLFLRWDDPKGKHWFHPDRFNIEATGPGIHCLPEDHYRTWPHKIPAEDIEAGIFLKSLTPGEELAEFVATRGYCILSNGRLRDAIETYRFAVKLAPHNRRFERTLRDLITHRKMLVRGHPFLNAPVDDPFYMGPKGPQWVSLPGGQGAVVQVLQPCEMAEGSDVFRKLGCVTIQHTVQLPNGPFAQAELPLQGYGRPMSASWLRLHSGEYALVHKLHPHGASSVLSPNGDPKRGEPILPKESAPTAWPTPGNSSVLQPHEQTAMLTAIARLSEHQCTRLPRPVGALALPPGPLRPRLETPVPRIANWVESLLQKGKLMYASLGPGHVAELDPPSRDGVDLLYSHEYVANRMSAQNSYSYVSNNPVKFVDPLGLEKVDPAKGVETRPCMVTILFGPPLFLVNPIKDHVKHYRGWSGWKPADKTPRRDPCYRIGAISCSSEQARIRGNIPEHLQIMHWPWQSRWLLKSRTLPVLKQAVDRSIKEAAYLPWCEICCCAEITLRIICQPDAAKWGQAEGGDAQLPGLNPTADRFCGEVKVDTPTHWLGPGRYPITPWYVGEFRIMCSDLPSVGPEEYHGR
ncbi:MAG TPA: hypothetical protein VMY37_06685 [Thermoguttaceae bacterium]|nr:hypothetical protein [Thermoguttaceae bacterium]